jgi:hypothetical protein
MVTRVGKLDVDAVPLGFPLFAAASRSDPNPNIDPLRSPCGRYHVQSIRLAASLSNKHFLAILIATAFLGSLAPLLHAWPNAVITRAGCRCCAATMRRIPGNDYSERSAKPGNPALPI